MKQILVTGGAGFVGSHLCRALLKKEFSVVAIDDLSNGIKSNVHKDVVLIEADLSKDAWLGSLDSYKFDAVIHCAAQASNAMSFDDPQKDWNSNQVSTWNVINFCKQKSINRLIFTSTMSVYGEPVKIPTPVSEPPMPLTYYAAHKATAETYLKLSSGINWTIFRLYTTYGSGQNLANLNQGLIKIYLGFILRGEPITVRGSGERLRDIIHVSDVVRAIILSLENAKTYKQTYNLGSGVTKKVSEIIELLLNAAGKDAQYPVVYEKGDLGDPHSTHADIRNATDDFNWRPLVMPDDGIVLTVKQYLNFTNTKNKK
jgi:nucleoside-diphosphate-sugar epimerase